MNALRELANTCGNKWEIDAAAKKAVREASEKVNQFWYAPLALSEQMMDPENGCDQMAKAIALQWVDLYSGEGSMFCDEWNEAAVRMCKNLDTYAGDILQRMEDSMDICGQTWHNAAIFAAESLRMRHTLMQSFSSVLFCVLERCGKEGEELQNRMAEKIGTQWYRMPLA